MTNHYDNLPGPQSDSIKVLLTAFSGKAAFLISGTTLHTAFALPVNQYGGAMPKLSDDVANTVRSTLRDVKVFIIDEISMTGSQMLNRVNTRLIQISGVNKPFGGISVIVVGDLHQLPPVMDSPVFLPCSISELGILAGTHLWDCFQYFELPRIMRQKDEIELIEALRGLAIGQMAGNHIELFKSRMVSQNSVPTDAVRLYPRNEDVNNYNIRRLNNMIGSETKIHAQDTIVGVKSSEKHDKILTTLQNKKVHETMGLTSLLRLKIGIKVMMTINIDIEDGLVNGACGVLRHIHFEKDIPLVLYIHFDSKRVGQKLKAELAARYHHPSEDEKKEWVPILKSTKEITTHVNQRHQIYRKQFPVVLAEAVTIHKSQGQTYESVCVTLSAGKKRIPVTRPMLYVALSRVTKLSNLYIIGEFRPPALKEDDPVMNEISNLQNNKLLKLCYNSLDEKRGTVIGYHNVTSFLKYRYHLINDTWYSKCDFLILSETQTARTTNIVLPGFQIVKRFDDFDKPEKRGVSVYSKSEIVQGSKHRANRKLLFNCSSFHIE